MSGLFKCFTDWCNICEDTFHLGPLLCPFFMLRLILTKDVNATYLRKVLNNRNNNLTKCSRNNHKNLFLCDVSDKIDTFIHIGECIDLIDDLLQFGDGIAAVIIVNFINTSLQPYEEEVLIHLMMWW